MKKRYDKVYQFRIDLRDVRPPIWRRIQVPETYTFWDLHVAIQSAMGWTDSHLHEFEINDPTDGEKIRIGLPIEDYDDEVIPDWKRNIADLFCPENPKAHYIYDFGDCWEHLIRLEKVLPKEKNVDYPICIDGKRACPPEDCGGVWGYEEFLKAIRNPKHKEHKEMLEWIGGGFDPEHFDLEEIEFIDPDKHRRDALG